MERLRAIKDEGEAARIREAGLITAAVFGKVLRRVKPGVRESDPAAEIEYLMRKNGAEGAAFETIVASGPRAALPHARASSRALRENEFVIFDLGAILAGYAADMTRTVHIGEPSRRARSLYNAVAEAQKEASESVVPGVRAGDVDAVARHALAGRNLARFFFHSTGHGVGMDVHELPRLARGRKAGLRPARWLPSSRGYTPGVSGGIRVEDTLLVAPGGPEILTPAPKDRWIVE